tara:strand:- start:914 stop:1453 length:540 start_codon:yes stop_codon:yes gene_type:complete
MNYLFIDIRKSDEVYAKHLDYSKNYKLYTIPMNMIKFNKKIIINHLKYIDEIYIICNSGKRSNFIKNKYFKEYDKIKVSKELQFKNFTSSINKLKLNYDTIELNVITNGYNYYSIMRIIQTMIGTLILILGGYTLYEMNKYKKINRIPLIILMLFGFMSLINGLTSSCTLSEIFKNYLN